MKYVLDRFEGDYAILENLNSHGMEEINKSCLPDGIREGDVLVWNGEDFLYDDVETQNRQNSILNRFLRLKSED